MILTNNYLCLVDTNSKYDLIDLENNNNYLNLLSMFSNNKKQLLGESFITSKNKNYFNLFCIVDNKINEEYLKKSILSFMSYNYLSNNNFYLYTTQIILENKNIIENTFKSFGLNVIFLKENKNENKNKK
ncbi:MAG: hypothetical protein ACRCW9_09970 [Cetobacterium sp.]